MPDSLPPELVSLRGSLESFIDELRELEAELPQGTAQEVPAPIATRVRQRSRDLGLYGMTQPVELGGSAAGALALTVVRESLAASNLRLGRLVLGPDPGVLVHVGAELREPYLEAVLRGEKRAGFAFTEPRDAEHPTSARPQGDDLIVNGRKAYVTNGSEADFFTTVVNVRAPEASASGSALLLIDRHAPGVEIEEEFSSLEGGRHASVRFSEVRVPREHLIGEVGEGLPRALRSISEVRLAMSAVASGMAMWTLDFVTREILEPHRSGSPLAEHESIRLRYADMRIAAYVARSSLYRTARLAEAGDNVVNEVMATKIFTTEMVGKVVDQALQLVGGRSLVVGHPLEALYRRVRSMRLAEGANDLLRLHLARGRLELDKGRL